MDYVKAGRLCLQQSQCFILDDDTQYCIDCFNTTQSTLNMKKQKAEGK